MMMLSDQDFERFNYQGWCGPFSLMTAVKARGLAKRLSTYNHLLSSPQAIFRDLSQEGVTSKIWCKHLHRIAPEALELSKSQEISHKVQALGYPTLWGTTYVEKSPRELHQWHLDIEHTQWSGVSVMLGLSNTSQMNSLRVLSGSHRYYPFCKVSDPNHFDDLQVIFNRDIAGDCSLKSEVYSIENTNLVVEDISLEDGEFFLFHQHLWHCSLNRSSRIRSSLLLQFTTPYAEISIPNRFRRPAEWISLGYAGELYES